MKDEDAFSVPLRAVKLPPGLSTVGRPGRNRPGQFSHFFENGITREGEAYPIELPTENPDYDRARRRVSNALYQARNRYNAGKPNRADHLTHRVHSEPGTMWIAIVKKYTDN